jgi:hypothetical protein
MDLKPSFQSRMLLRYQPPEWEIMFEVGDSTGGARRFCDAVTMGTYPSRGLPIHGFELKSHRGDWLNELKNPDKAAVMHKFCDFWWLVVDDKNIVKDDELPLGWGLLIPRGDGLVAAVKPTINADCVVQKGARGFMASMIRRAGEAARAAEVIRKLPETLEAEVKKRVEKRVKDSVEYETAQIRRELERLKHTYEKMGEQHAEFEKVTGISLSNPASPWGPFANFSEISRAANALALMRRTNNYDIKHHIDGLRKECEATLAGATAVQELLTKLAAEKTESS